MFPVQLLDQPCSKLAADGVFGCCRGKVWKAMLLDFSDVLHSNA